MVEPGGIEAQRQNHEDKNAERRPLVLTGGFGTKAQLLLENVGRTLFHLFIDAPHVLADDSR